MTWTIQIERPSGDCTWRFGDRCKNPKNPTGMHRENACPLAVRGEAELTSEAEYEAALAHIQPVVDRIAEYEAEHFPIDPPSPEDAAQFRAEQEVARENE